MLFAGRGSPYFRGAGRASLMTTQIQDGLFLLQILKFRKLLIDNEVNFLWSFLDSPPLPPVRPPPQLQFVNEHISCSKWACTHLKKLSDSHLCLRRFNNRFESTKLEAKTQFKIFYSIHIGVWRGMTEYKWS